MKKKDSNTLIGVKVSGYAENSIRTQIAPFLIWRKIDPPSFFLLSLHLRNTFSTYFMSYSDNIDTFQKQILDLKAVLSILVFFF